MKLLFVIGGIVVSGGNYVIFQHAMHASEAGHDVTLVVMSRFTPEQVAWHPGLAKLKPVFIDDFKGAETVEFDIAIATYWLTALELYKFRSRQYAYFVQSIESRFFPGQTALQQLVDQTYALGLPGITEATWIQKYLKQHYGSHYLLAHNGIRKDLYAESGPTHAPRKPGKLRVLVEGPFSSRFKNTARSVVLAGRGHADETWLLTSTSIPWYPGVDRLFSRVPIDDVAQVYRSCDVILKLSFVEGMFGPPLEMFHCGGTAVVYDVSGHDEYIVDGRNALVAKMNDEAMVVEHLRGLREDPKRLADLKAGARETAMNWPDWTRSSSLFVRHLEELRSSTPVDRDKLAAETRRLRTEFAECLVPHLGIKPAAAAAAPSGLRAGVRRVKTRLRPLTQLAGYIMEGYGPAYDHTQAQIPSNSTDPVFARENGK